jgi:hypothetical protein
MSQRYVMFSVPQDAPLEQLHAVLEHVKKLEGVKAVGPLFPEAKDAGLQRIGFAHVEEAADPHKLVQQVSSLPNVAKASLEAERRLT